MPKRVLQGVVVSDKTDKTIVVKVERRFTHPVLKKTVRRTKNYHAHDEGNLAKTGQIVQIEESRPFSKTKTWKLVDGAARSRVATRAWWRRSRTRSAALVDRVKGAVGLS